MNIRLIISCLIVFATGLLQAETASFFNDSMSVYYSESLLRILSVSNYVTSIFTPFSLWVIFTLLVHMMTVILDKDGSIKGLLEESGLSFLPFLVNFLALYIILITSSVSINDQVANLMQDRNYDIRLSGNVYLSTFKIIGNICSIVFLVIYCLVTRQNYKLTYFQSIICVILPITLYFVISYLFF